MKQPIAELVENLKDIHEIYMYSHPWIYKVNIQWFCVIIVVHGPAQARKPGQAKPYLSQAKPGQTIWPEGAFGPAQGFSSPSQAVKPQPKGIVF